MVTVMDRESDGDAGTSAQSELTSMVALANAVFAGLAGVFTATGSVMITVLAAGLVALLGLSVALRRRMHRGSG